MTEIETTKIIEEQVWVGSLDRLGRGGHPWIFATDNEGRVYRNAGEAGYNEDEAKKTLTRMKIKYPDEVHVLGPRISWQRFVLDMATWHKLTVHTNEYAPISMFVRLEKV